MTRNKVQDFKKLILIAKPWRGGLAKYIYLTLEQMFPGRVDWFPTRPVRRSEQIEYRLNKKRWEEKQLTLIASKERDLAIFINPPPCFSRLDYHPGNVAWLTDGPEPRNDAYSPYAKIYLSDVSYLPNLSKVVASEKIGGELAFACCPEIHHWNRTRSERKQLCFIGNKDQKRDSYLEQLLKTDLSFSVIGNYFFRHPLFWRHPSHFSPSIANEKMGQVYAEHKLSLNLHANVVRHGTNMRTFECAAYGVPQLVEYRPGLEDFFELDREIATFKSCDEMQDKLAWLLDDSDSRLKMAYAAKERVMSEHSYQHRLIALLNCLS